MTWLSGCIRLVISKIEEFWSMRLAFGSPSRNAPHVGPSL